MSKNLVMSRHNLTTRKSHNYMEIRKSSFHNKFYIVVCIFFTFQVHNNKIRMSKNNYKEFFTYLLDLFILRKVCFHKFNSIAFASRFFMGAKF